MAETTSNVDLGQLIAGLLGVGGAGLGIAGGIAGQQQVQGQFDVARSQYQLLLSLFNLYNAQQQGFNQMQLAAYQQQVAQALQDYQAKQQVFQQNQQVFQQNQAIEQQRLGIAQRLQDPNQVAAGAQGYLNPFLSTMEDRTAQALQRNLVQQGLASGGAVNQAVANAETGVLGNAYQQALQNYLGTQQGALGALTPMGYSPYGPNGPYTPGPPQPATALGRAPNVPAAPTGSPLGAAGGGLSALGPAVQALLQGLGLAPNQYQQLLRALGGGSTGGTGSTGTGLDINAGGGYDPGTSGGLDINAGGGVDTSATTDTSWLDINAGGGY